MSAVRLTQRVRCDLFVTAPYKTPTNHTGKEKSPSLQYRYSSTLTVSTYSSSKWYMHAHTGTYRTCVRGMYVLVLEDGRSTIEHAHALCTTTTSFLFDRGSLSWYNATACLPAFAGDGNEQS